MTTSKGTTFPDVAPISTHTFRMSKFSSQYHTADMVYGVYAGNVFPMINSDDPEHKYWLLRNKVAIYDVPERPLEISGPDAEAFLEFIFCRTISTLKVGRGRYAIACTHNGGVFMDGVLFRLDPDRFWYVQADGAMETWLIAHSAGFDVRISDPKSQVLQIQGPSSLHVMKAASDGAINDSMGYFHSGFYELGGQKVFVSRTGWTGERGYEVYTLGDDTEHQVLWRHLIAAGKPFGMEFATADPMEPRRIEAGILDNLIDMDMGMTPYQAGLGAFVDLEKPDFLGRDALLQADRNPLLFGLKCSATPSRGAVLLDGDLIVGRVTNGSWSPSLNCGIGYARFDAPGDWPNRSLNLKQPGGEIAPCEIVELPFLDPEKLLARGLVGEAEMRSRFRSGTRSPEVSARFSSTMRLRTGR